jgi:DnaK suppressor protein
MVRQKKTDTEDKKQTKGSSKNNEQSAASKKSSKVNSKTKPAASSSKSKTQKKTKASGWRDKIKEMLLQMKKELLQGVVQSIKDESDYLKNDVGDFYDHASNDRDRELALTFTDRERTKLVQIDEALKRIEEGGYGECDNCMDEIGEDRLKVMPFAKLCLSCKIELERHGEL